MPVRVPTGAARGDGSANVLSGVDDSKRPRERLDDLGPRALSDAELIALLLRTGGAKANAEELARQCLAHFGGLGAMASRRMTALQGIPGMGPAKAASLEAAFELGRRVVAEPLGRGEVLSSPLELHRALLPWTRSERRESFKVLLLDARHRIVALRLVSIGTLTASLVHPREVFREAIESGAAAIIVVHNHPSGDPRPSEEDRKVTRRLRAAGDLLGIQVLDHVIVSATGFFSFRESGEELGAAAERSGAARDP